MNKNCKKNIFEPVPLLSLSDINLNTPDGRPLFSDLNMILNRERVAVIGRNGVGKSSLLNMIQGHLYPDSGNVHRRTEPYLVPQQIDSVDFSYFEILPSLFSEKKIAIELRAAGFTDLSVIKHLNRLSNGEKRKLNLLAAKLSCSDLLMLDEPTEDLDEIGVKWLTKWLSWWPNGLLVVSHDRELLSNFEHFFIIMESGCSYFTGTFSEVSQHLEQKADDAETRYLFKLQTLGREEERRSKVLRRRRRKKNYGRISELERCTPKQRLNKKRSLAQVSQGKAAKISQERIRASRDLTMASRRALAVKLPFELSVPKIDNSGPKELIRFESVAAKFNQHFLFKDMDFSIGFEHFAVVGPNGSGKTTLLNILTGNIKPYTGTAKAVCRLGTIAQEGSNWMVEDSLFEFLMHTSRCESIDEIAQVLLMHKFPIALANRPLRSLSPGERVRAAFISLFQRTPILQLLVLDEPTYSLDFVGERSLREALKAWPGALVVASHNRDFLASIGVTRSLELDGQGKHTLMVH